MLRIQPLNHRERSIAAGIHAVVSLAYAQEASLLPAADGPASPEGVEDIVAGRRFYIGAVLAPDIVGILSLGPDDDPRHLCICSLAVHPRVQRQGVATLLLRDAIARGPGLSFVVATTAANAPALALYARLGFKPYRQGVIGPHELPLIKLKRTG